MDQVDLPYQFPFVIRAVRKRAVPTVSNLHDGAASAADAAIRDRIGNVPRNQHHPTPAERDERVKLDLPPDEAIKLILETGENPEDEKEDAPKK